jgi:hypothetical protein
VVRALRGVAQAGLDHEGRRHPTSGGCWSRRPGTPVAAPQVGYEPARRQRGQDPAVIERAWRCQQRLFKRWRRMAARGEAHQKIVVACARELAGFVRAIASDQPLRPAARADEDLSSRCRPTSRRTLDTSMRPAPAVTRDPRPRQLPTVPSHAVPTGESESDAPSLPWAVRCSRPRGGPPQPSREQPQAVG